LLDIFEIGSHFYFAWAGVEPWSSKSLE
jgi:hypothetical protein